MNIANALKNLYPNANPFTDYVLQDDLDGQGPRIVHWSLGPMPTLEELQVASDAYDAAMTKKTFLDEVQKHIESIARSRGYDSAVSLASYASDTHPPFAAEAHAFIPWRSSVWLYCYQEWAKFEAGQRQVTTAAAFINELPVIVWP